MILDYSASPPTANNLFKSKFCSQKALREIEGHITNLKPKMATKIKFCLPQPLFAKLKDKILIESTFTYINDNEFIEILTTTSPIMYNKNIIKMS